MNRLKSFTIMEMMVALAISAIVIAISYYAISSVRGLMYEKNQLSKSIESIQELRFLMHLDFNESANWERSKDNPNISSMDQSLKYEFRKNTVLRVKNGLSQTFEVEQLNFQIKQFENSKLVSVLKLELKSNGKIYPLNFQLNADVFKRLKVSENGN